MIVMEEINASVEPWKIDIIGFLENNYTLELSIEDMARCTGRSTATFKRDFAKVSNLTPHCWLIKRRLRAARELLSNDEAASVTEVCYRVGFKNLSHFSRCYKAEYGLAPSTKK